LLRDLGVKLVHGRPGFLGVELGSVPLTLELRTQDRLARSRSFESDGLQDRHEKQPEEGDRKQKRSQLELGDTG
jgi:hypothetical protein